MGFPARACREETAGPSTTLRSGRDDNKRDAEGLNSWPVEQIVFGLIPSGFRAMSNHHPAFVIRRPKRQPSVERDLRFIYAL